MSAWVIGGTSGIGAAITDRLLDLDMQVWSTGEKVDVTSYELILEQLDIIVQEQDETDKLEHVYFCAGVTELEWLGEMGPIGVENQAGVIDVNLKGFINLMDALAYYWKQGTLVSKDGPPMKVCAISSDAATRPMRTSIGYCASKAGLDMAIRVAARELGPQGWKVFGIAPGMIDNNGRIQSKMTAYIDRRVPDVREWSTQTAYNYEEQQAVIKRPLRIDPFKVADLAVETMLRVGRHVNGSIIQFNGGR
jgi:benzil reductase ((S)-benzoin forming)